MLFIFTRLKSFISTCREAFIRANKQTGVLNTNQVLLFKHGPYSQYLVISDPVQDEKAFIAPVKCWRRDAEEEGGGARSGEIVQLQIAERGTKQFVYQGGLCDSIRRTL